MEGEEEEEEEMDLDSSNSSCSDTTDSDHPSIPGPRRRTVDEIILLDDDDDPPLVSSHHHTSPALLPHWLFGVVGLRRTAKPGAALAAAAAASRPILAPHAAALLIQSRTRTPPPQELQPPDQYFRPREEEDDALVSEYVDGAAAADDQGIDPCSGIADNKGINAARDDLNSEISQLDDKSEPPSSTTDVESAAKNDLLDLAHNIIISQLEHKTVAKRAAEKKGARPLTKPLELAEELEKKHAFSGLDWENDIASQPTKLEGVRRGSIALGYFDVSARNTITRTVSSQLFRRDQGSPQSVAVHFNFVAVGFFKGC